MRIHHFLLVSVTLLLFLITAPTAHADHFADHIRGKILLDVENEGEAWYVYPVNDHRYSLGSPKKAFRLMRELGLGTTNENLRKIPKGNGIVRPVSVTVNI